VGGGFGRREYDWFTALQVYVDAFQVGKIAELNVETGSKYAMIEMPVRSVLRPFGRSRITA